MEHRPDIIVPLKDHLHKPVPVSLVLPNVLDLPETRASLISPVMIIIVTASRSNLLRKCQKVGDGDLRS